ncbi:GMC oxidoreductase [Dietzia timorensis]|uniref:Putative GMC-type oxidoreductase in thcA 5'region n=1 Tax=Dietzia timorensis TaxID=499555 RepID=A0A173LN61_9ACTN|nr:GMC oxidoreductase [Dietzia timorensis]ANI93094.1 putative GMC-type oxidoreductase in thcA 5'region [Dietzia timorensis]
MISYSSGAPRLPDVIIVGAGPAGAVLARRLADAGAEVRVLEAGPDTRETPRQPAALLPLSGDEPAARQIAARGRAGETVSVWRGRGPGGSGAINGAAWTPAPADVVKTWPGCTADRYARALGRAESVMLPVEVSPSPLAVTLSGVLGEPMAPGRLTVEPDGRRRDPWTAYCPERAGATLHCSAGVRELLLSGSDAAGPGGSIRAEGVVLDDGERLYGGEVVLAAGAIDTARLLRRAAANPVVQAHPEVRSTLSSAGRDAREHPETLLDLPGSLHTLLHEAPAGILGARIPLTIAGRRMEVRPYERPFHAAIPGLPEASAQIGVALLDPRSVSIVEDDRLTLSAVTDDSDREVLDAGAGLVADALATLAEARGGLAVGEVRRHTGYSQHLYATAPMGQVTDADGRVEGLDGLRVADAAILPPGLGAGPYASVFAVAEAVAESIAAGSRAGLAR